jgi:hypothetical protein
LEILFAFPPVLGSWKTRHCLWQWQLVSWL